MFVDEAHPDLAGVGRTEIRLDAHAARHLAGGAADVDVLPFVATLREYEGVGHTISPAMRVDLRAAILKAL